jgi:putative ABC transport system permease protein
MESIPPAVEAGGPGGFSALGRLSLRHFLQEPFRVLLTVLGIALGMGLVVAIRLANGAALGSFQDSIDLLAGKSNLALSSPTGTLPENLMADLLWTRRYGECFPLLQGKMAPVENPKEFLTLLGVDLLKDSQSRDYRILGADGAEMGRKEFLDRLPEPDALFLTQAFARRRGWTVGEKVPFLVGDRMEAFRIAGLLADSGAGRALDGTLALMDIAAAQKAFGKIGRLDRLEWVVPDRAKRRELEEKLRELYPAYQVQRPERRGAQVEKMLSAFRANLMALALVSLLVGAFLVYNSMSLAVLGRVREIGILRNLGATRGRVLAWILAEAFLISAAGSGLGLWLGRELARPALQAVGGTMRNLFLPYPLGENLPGLSAPAAWFLGGTAFILASALPPALAASRIEPTLSVRRGFLETAFGRRKRFLAGMGAGAWVGAAFLGGLPPVRGLPLFGYLAAFLLLIGAALLTPLSLSWLCGLAEWAAGGSLPAGIRIAFRNLRSGLGRSSVAVGALVMAVALMASVAAMVGSFRETVVLWLGQTLKADLYLRPAADEGGRMESTLDPGVLKALEGVPGVRAVERLRTLPLSFGGYDFFLSAMDLGVLSRNGGLVFKTRGPGKEWMEELASGEKGVFISEPLALRRGWGPGDWIGLPGTSGPVSLKVKAVYYDYSNDRGTVMMDLSTYRALFGDGEVNGAALYLLPGASPEDVEKDLWGRLPAGTRLFIRSNAELRAGALRIFDRTFSITYGMEWVALWVAVLGILTTLTALILERKDEILILRALGAEVGQVWRMILWEAGWMGFVGNLLGLAVGLVLAFLLIRVINVQSFGWTIQWHMPWPFLGEALPAILAATLLAGVFPARMAGRLRDWREVAGE